VLIEALALLPGVHALLVGTALFGDEAYADGLRRRAALMNLVDRIHFLGFRNDVPQLMSVANVVVHTSGAPDPFGRVLVEGMLAKRPGVPSRAGGIADIIEDRTSGVLVPPADPGDLAHALADLLNDNAQAGRIAANRHERANCHSPLDAMLGRIEQEIVSVLAGRPDDDHPFLALLDRPLVVGRAARTVPSVPEALVAMYSRGQHEGGDSGGRAG
jgi:glycosyltransferase involved in cell wall biosynthesis